MRELRVILWAVPPLLADLIRQVVAARFERRHSEQRALRPLAAPLGIHIADIPAFAGTELPCPRLDGADPHVVIVGWEAAASMGLTAPLLKQVPVLTLSHDLTRIYGPGEADSAPLTPDVLADRLFEIAAEI